MGRAGRRPAGCARTLLLGGVLAGLAACTDVTDTGSDSELIDAGRRIYQDGVLPDGEALLATRPEGLVLEGRYAACATCHRPSGMGSVEGAGRDEILVPPLAGPVLFAPGRFADSYLDETHHWVPNATWRRAMTRPAYDEASLATALREGRNTANETMAAPMPLYDLDDGAIAALAAYLETLGSQADPGIDPDAVHVATVITPDANPADAEAMLAVLGAWTNNARGAGAPYRLHVWWLSGAPAEWRAQLDALYKERPVFALLSGLGIAEWRPVHDFCEDQGVACVLPSVDLVPAGARDDHYSVYYSPGLPLEAAILADYLGAETVTGRIVQLHADPAGEAAAQALGRRLSSGDSVVDSRRFRVTAPLPAVEGLEAEDVLVVWLRAPEVNQLVTALPDGPPVSRVVFSGLLATPEDVSLTPAWRQRASFVTLFDDLGLQTEIARLRLAEWLKRYGIEQGTSRRLLADAYAAAYLLDGSFGRIRGEEVRRPEVPYTRDHLLESLEDLLTKLSDGTRLVDEDSHVAYYGRMSLGPGQRIAVRGGSILSYASPESDRLKPASKRIVPITR